MRSACSARTAASTSALRMQQVQAELDDQLQRRARGERGGQRLLAAGLLGALGLIGALGAMFLTQPPRPAQAAHSGPEPDIAAQEASAAIEAMRRELGQLRSANAREQALIDAAAALLPDGTPAPAPAVATPKPSRPRPTRPVAADPAPKPPRIKVCKDLDDPLAEDC